MNDPVRLEEINADLLLKIENEREELRLKELTNANLKKVGEQLKEAKKYLAEVKNSLSLLETRCAIKAVRALNMGYTEKELAETIGVSVRTINKWVNNERKNND